MKKTILFLILILFNLSILANIPLDAIKLPPGFQISLYALVPNAREMALGDNGTVFVGTRGGDKVYALTNRGKKFQQADDVITLMKGLNAPNGVAIYQGNLYVAEIHRITRYDAIEKNLINPKISQVIRDDFFNYPHHGHRYIKFSPDGWLYMGSGAPCNTCISDEPRFGTILKMKPDGTDLQIYARGVRNTMGFDWQPETGILWFTENGRDRLGDEIPPDELNQAAQAGLNFGFPYFYGKNVPDPDYQEKLSVKDFVPSAWNFPAHVAPLGMTFYKGDQFPAEYKNNILVAEHGSWNRSKKIGYRISKIVMKNHKPVAYKIFAQGWLQGENYWGRPVDILQLPDGSILVSDDFAGAVYRIAYVGKK